MRVQRRAVTSPDCASDRDTSGDENDRSASDADGEGNEEEV